MANHPSARKTGSHRLPEPPSARRTGRHRLPEPPTALRGRAAIAAVAAGATVTAGAVSDDFGTNFGSRTDSYASDVARTAEPQAAPFFNTAATSTLDPSEGPQLLNLASNAGLAEFDTVLSKGRHYSADREAREAALLRPLFVKPTSGQFTSGYGMRWGALHQGVDIAAPIGTPIYAVGDGIVLEAGPTDGYGMWVQLKHADGTVTMYAHVDTTAVSVGQRVLAGDQIATVGNRGFSTGPHLEMQVWPTGSQTAPIDPEPWLASRGISL